MSIAIIVLVAIAIQLIRWPTRGLRVFRQNPPKDFVESIAEYNQAIKSLRELYWKNWRLAFREDLNSRRAFNQSVKRQFTAVATAFMTIQAETNRVLQFRQSTELALLDGMSGEQFEHACATILRRHGYQVDTTRASGDFGADLVLRSGARTIVVQCKRYHKTVGVKAVQEVNSAKTYYKAIEAWVITNSHFSAPALALAQSNKVHMVDRDGLSRLVSSILLNDDERLRQAKASARQVSMGLLKTVRRWQETAAHAAAQISELRMPKGETEETTRQGVVANRMVFHTTNTVAEQGAQGHPMTVDHCRIAHENNEARHGDHEKQVKVAVPLSRQWLWIDATESSHTKLLGFVTFLLSPLGLHRWARGFKATAAMQTLLSVAFVASASVVPEGTGVLGVAVLLWLLLDMAELLIAAFPGFVWIRRTSSWHSAISIGVCIVTGFMGAHSWLEGRYWRGSIQSALFIVAVMLQTQAHWAWTWLAVVLWWGLDIVSVIPAWYSASSGGLRNLSANSQDI